MGIWGLDAFGVGIFSSVGHDAFSDWRCLGIGLLKWGEKLIESVDARCHSSLWTDGFFVGIFNSTVWEMPFG